MGFPERTESFDFNVALQDWSKRQNPPKLTAPASSSSSSDTSPHLPSSGARDFSLKEGETISIKLGGASAIKKRPAGQGAGEGVGGLGGFKLAPPPPPPPRAR
ncbi:hypothetical protein JCM21900_001332 [Sporobolomyces salmonicolor]